MHRILIDKNLCEGCKTCVLACMMRNTKAENLYTIDLNSIDTESKNHIEMDINNHPVPIFCRHCDEPECVMTCMSGAMSKDEKTGIVSYDEDKCGSCFMCVMSCPYGLLKADDRTKSKILKCDLCKDEETPRCVKMCPTGAIKIQKEDVYAR